MKTIGIIPARYASTRFPAKPLAMLGGKMVVQRVYGQVAGLLDRTVVATDDERIAEAVRSFGGEAVMTSPSHRSGTDRCREALDLCGGDYDIVINIQGDEPFVRRSQLSALLSCFDDTATDIATLVKPMTEADGWEAIANPNSPKVVVDATMHALYFSRSVILTDYPKEIKAFYMKLNDDGKTVRAMDVLFPKIGEIIGGSEREADYNKLLRRIEELHIPMKDMWWYLDTRRFGSCPHSGFGLGFERLLLFVTGMANIRDVIPFPRTPKNAEF